MAVSPPVSRITLRVSLLLLMLVLTAAPAPAARVVETFDGECAGTCFSDVNAVRLAVAEESCIYAAAAPTTGVLRTKYSGGASYSAAAFPPSPVGGFFSVMFFDDMGVCDAPFLPPKTQMALVREGGSTGTAYGLGVMTTQALARNYAVMVNGAVQGTNVPRTYGWHQFTFFVTLDEMVMSIDGVVVRDVYYPQAPSEFVVGDLWGGAGSNRGASWWDDAVVIT